MPLDGKKQLGTCASALSWVDEGAPSADTAAGGVRAAAPTSSPAGRPSSASAARSGCALCADRGGTSDPYVKLKLGGTERKSKVIKGTVAPVWDETFEFRGTLGGVRGLHLVSAVYDHDGLSFNDSLGEARLSLASFGRTATEHTLLLEGKKATGEVTIGVEWVADPPTAEEVGGGGACGGGGGGGGARRGRATSAQGASRSTRLSTPSAQATTSGLDELCRRSPRLGVSSRGGPDRTCRRVELRCANGATSFVGARRSSSCRQLGRRRRPARW